MTLDLAAFFRAYLFAYIFWHGLPLGALMFMMIHPLVGGSWGTNIRPVMRAMVRTLPGTALLFLPVVAGLRFIYPWTFLPPENHLGTYFTPPFFLARAIVYFVVWIFLARAVSRESLIRLKAVCAAGIIVHFFVMTLAAIDWVMSLEPEYYSTNFGLIIIAGQVLVALAFILLAKYVLGRRGVSVEGPLLKEKRLTYRDLGSLLATTVLLWAYLEYAQLIVNWSGDMKREASWYVHHSQGGWSSVAAALVAFNFAAPFFVLLFRRVKEAPRYLALVGAGIVVMHVVDTFWLVMPSFRPAVEIHWFDLVIWAAVGLIWLAAFRLNVLPVKAAAP